jgi:hypothetical protein
VDKLFSIFLLLVSLVTLVRAQTPAPSDVHFKLSLADNKTVYRIGERIPLVMEFTAEREGYNVEILPDSGQPALDDVVVSPDAGITHWLDELNDNRRYGRHVVSTDKLTSSPRRVEMILNDTLRFDSPGRYTVGVTTRRVAAGPTNPPVFLTSNSISFEIQAMSEADEAKEVKRISDLLDTKRGYESDEELSKQLSYLTGDPSTHEKVRRFIKPEQRGGNYHSNLWSGLFIARNRALVLRLVEAALRDPNIPVTTQILYSATRLKMLFTHGVRNKPVTVADSFQPEEDPRSREIRDAYVVELAAGLGKRTGTSQTTTAMTILSSPPKDPQAASAGLRETKRILVQQFDTLHPYSQDLLLRMSWDQLQDPALIPPLKKMLASSDVTAKRIREIVLKRLIEIAPDEARPYVIAEIRDPSSLVDPKTLGALKEESLPEVDGSLLEQIRPLMRVNQGRDRTYLKFKASLLVRFATDSIYRDLIELYRPVAQKLPPDGRGVLLAYFAKHNEQDAIPLIEQAVSDLKPQEEPAVLRELTALYYSDAIGVIVKKLLETDDVSAASHAAYLLSLHGSAGDEQVLEARLKRWQEQWRNRVAEADAQRQGRIERELIHALIIGKSWKFPPERVRELRMSCITQLCKSSSMP